MRTFGLSTDTEIREETYLSNTYAMRAERIEGYIDGLEAVKQSIFKILNTEQYEYPVYSFSYGVELNKLIGKEQPYVRSELKRIVTEALLKDERIRSIAGFEYEFAGDICKCTFTVESIYGIVPGSMEVNI